eukprot:360641-Chlamydomonas_euryale.AAC.3
MCVCVYDPDDRNAYVGSGKGSSRTLTIHVRVDSDARRQHCPRETSDLSGGLALCGVQAWTRARGVNIHARLRAVPA